MVTEGVGNITKIPELRKRILFTIAMLGIYRIGIFITSPGVDRVVLKKIFGAASGTLFSLFNLFSGGALEQMSIFALGIMPYISASIILQLLTVVIPTLDRLKKEGEVGQKKINQYTRYGTVLLSVIQGFGIAHYLESLKGGAGELVVHEPGMTFKFITVISLTTGTAFIMWLGEQITAKGIGNGISMIIFAGIVARTPDAIFQTITMFRQDIIKLMPLLGLVILMLVIIVVIIFFERGQRRIPVQYRKRMVGRKMYAGQSSYLPLKVNTAGVIPPIFASSILLFPATMASFVQVPWINDIQYALSPGSWIYNTVYVGMIIFFCYFYTAVTFNPDDVAENIKKNGGSVPGIRAGKKTAEYIDKVLTRITFGGALYISVICVLPTILMDKFSIPFYFGGTSLLIVVGVALDTAQQIESHLITRHYDGFSGGGGARIRGRRG